MIGKSAYRYVACCSLLREDSEYANVAACGVKVRAVGDRGAASMPFRADSVCLRCCPFQLVRIGQLRALFNAHGC